MYFRTDSSFTAWRGLETKQKKHTWRILDDWCWCQNKQTYKNATSNAQFWLPKVSRVCILFVLKLPLRHITHPKRRICSAAPWELSVALITEFKPCVQIFQILAVLRLLTKIKSAIWWFCVAIMWSFKVPHTSTHSSERRALRTAQNKWKVVKVRSRKSTWPISLTTWLDSVIDEDVSFLPHLSPLASPLFLLRYSKLSIIVPVISIGEQLSARDCSEALTLIYVVCVRRALLCWGLERIPGAGRPLEGILTHPLALFPLQLAKEDLQLFYSDAVAGQHTQHVHQQVCKARVKNRNMSESFRGKEITQLQPLLTFSK